MKELTRKEEEVMQFFWDEGALFVKDLVEKYDEPKPHFNTISTYVRALEKKGLLSHENLGLSYRYFPVVTEEEYRNRTLKKVVSKHFDNSYLNVVSAFIKEEKISIEEVRKLIDDIQNQRD